MMPFVAKILIRDAAHKFSNHHFE